MSMSRAIQDLLSRRNAYRATFLRANDTGPDQAGQLVLRDLARFCRANRSSLTLTTMGGTIDPLATAAAEGRREVFLRIAKFIHLSDADVARLLESEGRPND